MYVCGGASQEVLVLKNSPATAGDVRDTGSIPTQKKRHRCTEQTFGVCGRRRGWGVLRE